MQVKDQTVIHRNKYTILKNILKSVVTLACLYFLWDQFQKQDIDSVINWPKNVSWVILAVFVLMILNWYLEALRWKRSLTSVESISIQEAWKSVLGGLALNWILPFTSGDFLLRIIARKDKQQTTSAIILNRAIMLILTIGFGVFSIRYYEQSLFSINKLYVLILVVLPILLVLFRKKLKRFLNYFRQIQIRLLVEVSSISVLRYFVFTFQFYWLLSVFNSELPSVILIAGIGWIFFARSIIPHLLGGIGLREAASIVFFIPYVADLSTILLPVFIIWLINTVIPSIAGSVLIWGLKWRSISDN